MSHYNTEYFAWQQQAGVMAGRANLIFYKSYITSEDNVLDFGCGGGYLLAQLDCKCKLGIEINEDARRMAKKMNIATVPSVKDCADEWADVIISCHALEHTFNPLQEIKSLYPKLKKGGKIIFIVPQERKVRYKTGDINQHLFTWSEMNLGNLFSLAGFKVLRVDEILHRFPPGSKAIMKFLGISAFHLASRMYGMVSRNITQVRVVAEK